MALEGLLLEADRPALVRNDPVELVRRYRDPHDQEVAGLLVAGLAYGRVSSIRDRAGAALDALGPRPSVAIASAEGLAALEGFVYRFQRGDDLPRFARAMATLRQRHGSLAAAFALGVRPEAPDHADAAARFVAELRDAFGGTPSYGLRYLLPDPASGGAAKRLFLYLRWMIRPEDGLDLGAWPALVPELRPAGLILPLDTHISRIGRYLGLSDRNADDLRTAREMTATLRALDPEDPVRYDMALCHLGISGRCPRALDADKCRVCTIAQVCRVPLRQRR